jgi:adenylate kinase family enzyme
MKKIVINLLSGPGSGKTTLAAKFFFELKMKCLNIEYVQEYVKQLVWLKEYELINNQYFISTKQYELTKNISNGTEFVITDGSLLNGLIYNKINKDNVSNINKTEDFIWEKYKEFENVNFFIKRLESAKYEKEGRLESEESAKYIDLLYMELLKKHNIPYYVLDLNKYSIDELTKYFLDTFENEINGRK